MPWNLLGTVSIDSSEDVGVEFAINALGQNPPFCVEFVPSSALPNDWTVVGSTAAYQFVEDAVVIHPVREVFAFPGARSLVVAPNPVLNSTGVPYFFGVLVWTRQLSVAGTFRLLKFVP